MKTIELLKKARELITDPEHWVKHRYGVASDGRNLGVSNIHCATKFCAAGALYRTESDTGKVALAKHELHESIKNGEEKFRTFSLAGFNDQTSHQEVLALYDTTIERLEA